MKRNLMTWLYLVVVATAFISKAEARKTIHLKSKTKQICIGKSKQLMAVNTQLQWWTVDGKSNSRKSTWWYKGDKVKLKLDTDEANVVATCKKKGSEKFHFTFKRAYADPNIYSIYYKVKCVPCTKQKVQAIKRKAKVAVAIVRDLPMSDGYAYKEVQKMMADAMGMVELEQAKVKSPYKKKLLRKLMQMLSSLNLLLMEGDVWNEKVDMLLESITTLVQKLKA